MSDATVRNRTDETPLVSVGIPVFNGENYLEEAIRSVLGQTLGDLELVISDNASTDRTAEICQDYARSDRRVRFFRNATNMGAIPNYNRVFDESRARYFKWLAHDDKIQPSYLQETVEELESDPSLVLCNTVIQYIGQDGSILGNYETVLAHACRERAAERLSTMILRSHSCVDFFAVFRRSMWAGRKLPSFHGEDRLFLAAAALAGRLKQLPQPLVQMREHPNRYTRAVKSAKARLAWHDTARAGRIDYPTFRLYKEYRQLVRDADLPAAEREACRRVLTRWWFHNWHSLRAAVDVAEVLVPGTVAVAERAKTRLFGAAPGHTFVDAKRK